MTEQNTEQKIEDLTKHFYYLSNYVQMSSLSTAYRDYRLRNEILENKLRENLRNRPRPLRVSYFVHIIDQLSYSLVDALRDDAAFDLRLLVFKTEQADFLREKGYDTYVVHSLWDEFPNYKPEDGEGYRADICFSEMPYGILPSLENAIRPWMISGEWLPRYRDIFTLDELNNSLFCCLQYAFTLSNEWSWLKSSSDFNVHYNLPYNNFSWLYFLESDAHLTHAVNRNYWGNTSNYVVTGYPKYDAYQGVVKAPISFRWNHPRGERRRIIYAPHFYRSDDFLAQTCQTLLELAATGAYEIVFKPHPNPNKIVNSFLPQFYDHPDIHVEVNSDSSQYIFATADLAIISSVSMHADAVFADIPFISELGVENFSHIGRQVQEVGYVTGPDTPISELVKSILE